MSDKKSYKKSIYKTAIIILLVVFCVRTFLIDSISISTSYMENALYKGDRVFVDKATYGVRMPISLLSIPFTFDSFLGLKSYSDLIELPYKRVGENPVRRNDIVLLNDPLDKGKPIDKKKLIISRCIGLPGDTISKEENAFYVNYKPYISSPDLLQEYRIGEANSTSPIDVEKIKLTLKQLKIPQRNLVREGNSLKLNLSRYEAYLFKQTREDFTELDFTEDSSGLIYTITVPKKGESVNLNESNIILYASVIALDSDNSFILNDGEIISAKTRNAISKYSFRSDYYWFISDNLANSNDSQTIGFVPFSHVIGRVSYIWMGSDIRLKKFDRFIHRSNN